MMACWRARHRPIQFNIHPTHRIDHTSNTFKADAHEVICIDTEILLYGINDSLWPTTNLLRLCKEVSRVDAIFTHTRNIYPKISWDRQHANIRFCGDHRRQDNSVAPAD